MKPAFAFKLAVCASAFLLLVTTSAWVCSYFWRDEIRFEIRQIHYEFSSANGSFQIDHYLIPYAFPACLAAMLPALFVTRSLGTRSARRVNDCLANGACIPILAVSLIAITAGIGGSWLTSSPAAVRAKIGPVVPPYQLAPPPRRVSQNLQLSSHPAELGFDAHVRS